MSNKLHCWNKPRLINVVVDNPSWILPYAEELVEYLNVNGDQATIRRSHQEIQKGDIAFYLGCIHIAPEKVLKQNTLNLTVHESNLPQGRGFSPLTWQILEGKNEIPICLLEITGEVDAGPVIYRETMKFEGHELIGELREIQGQTTLSLCIRYLSSDHPPEGISQSGVSSLYDRRRPEDSRLNLDVSLADNFSLLRVVDNENYPAFFEIHGKRYMIRVEKYEDS